MKSLKFFFTSQTDFGYHFKSPIFVSIITYLIILSSPFASADQVLTPGEGVDLTSSGAGGTLTISGEDATDTNKGIATFNTDDFVVVAGDVTIKAAGIDLTAEVSGTLPVANGGTGATTLTDGGVLLGSGSGAVTPMAVLTDGQVIIGDGTTDPTVVQAFDDSATPVLRLQVGGVNADISAYSTGLIGLVTGTTTDIDTKAELETTIGLSSGDLALAVGDIYTGVHDFGGVTDFEVENGANPTVDTAGEVSVDTSATSGSMLRFYGDAEYCFPAYHTKSLVIVGATADSDYPIWRVPYNITIRAIHVLVEGGTNVIGGLDEADANGDNGVAVDADITGTAGSNVNDDGILTNPSVDSGDYILWHTTSVSGTNTSLSVSFEYTIDAVN